MDAEPDARAKRLRFLGNAILVAGLLAALAIYRTATPPPDDPLADPEASKQSLRQMQVYGGEANVLATEFREGFESLWQGRQLAYAVAILSLIGAAGCRFAAIPLPSPEPGVAPDNTEGSRKVDPP